MIHAIIYTKNQCPNCTTAKQLLEQNSIPYESRNIENPLWLQTLQSLRPDAKQMPQIFLSGQPVGGLAGLQQALKTIQARSNA